MNARWREHHYNVANPLPDLFSAIGNIIPLDKWKVFVCNNSINSWFLDGYMTKDCCWIVSDAPHNSTATMSSELLRPEGKTACAWHDQCPILTINFVLRPRNKKNESKVTDFCNGFLGLWSTMRELCETIRKCALRQFMEAILWRICLHVPGYLRHHISAVRIWILISWPQHTGTGDTYDFASD